MVVFHFIHEGVADADLWVHPSYLNMSSFDGSVLPLEVDDDEFRQAYSDRFDEVLLRLASVDQPLLGAEPWSRALLTAERLLNVRWSVVVFCLSSSGREASDEFVPGHIVVERSRFEAIQFWDPSRYDDKKVGKGKPNKKTRRDKEDTRACAAPAVAAPLGDAAAGDAADSDDDGGSQSGSGSGEELAEEADEEDQWEDLSEVQIAAARMGWIAPDDADEGDDIGDDDEGEFDERPDETVNMPHPQPMASDDETHGGERASGSGGPGPAAAAADPAAAATAAPPAPFPAHVPRSARRPDFPQAVHPSMNGYIRLSQTKGVAHMDSTSHRALLDCQSRPTRFKTNVKEDLPSFRI
jgi:hypothetical protein